MPVVKQLTVTLDNRPGALAELCSELAKVAVNIQAIQASEAGALSPVRLIVSQVEPAKRVCDYLRLKWAENEVVAVRVGDRPGALGRVTRKLAEKGINIEYLYGTIERGSRQALIVIGVKNAEAAARVAK